MKIFFDFDDVLFNTGDFVRDLMIIFGKNGLSKEEHKYFCNKYYKQGCFNGEPCFNLEKYLEFLKNKNVSNVDLIKAQCDEMFCDLSKYVFKDARKFLKKNKGNGLGILTFGDNDFQRMKISRSGLDEFFDEIIVTQGKKSDALKSAESDLGGFIFLDDRVENLRDVKNNFGESRTVFVKRLEGRYDDQEDDCCDFVIKNLSDFEFFMKK